MEADITKIETAYEDQAAAAITAAFPRLAVGRCDITGKIEITLYLDLFDQETAETLTRACRENVCEWCLIRLDRGPAPEYTLAIELLVHADFHRILTKNLGREEE